MPEAPARPARVAVLVSGQGRNLRALIDACAAGRVPAQIVAVISNRADAPALARAQASGIATAVVAHRDYPDRAQFDAALAERLDALRPDFVLLAGFMRILTPAFVQRFAGRLINIHPSLLPRHPGLDTHRRAIEAGDAQHGATVHYVTEELDGGPGILQGRVSVLPHDDADTLAERVMHQVETRIYPQVLAWLARGELALMEGRVQFRGRTLDGPLSAEAIEDPFR